MAQVVKLKRSAEPDAIPTTSDLEDGELAVNTNDGRLFMKRDSGTPEIITVGRSITVSADDPSGGQDGDIWIQYYE